MAGGESGGHISRMERKGDEAMEEAKKILGAWSLFGSGSKYEDAAEAFARAGNSYKATKVWEKASDAYKQAGDSAKRGGDEMDAARYYKMSAECMRNVDASSAAQLLQAEVIPRMVEGGKFTMAARELEGVAQALEKDEDFDTAIELYEEAAGYFGGEKQTSSEHKCKLRIAEIRGRRGEFSAAAEIFEEVGQGRLDNELTKFSAKGHFLDASLCYLANGDAVAARAAVERYKGLDYSFPDSRECKLAENLIQAVEDSKVEDFTEHIYQFDRISKLSPWRTAILLKTKNQIASASEAPALDLS